MDSATVRSQPLVEDAVTAMAEIDHDFQALLNGVRHGDTLAIEMLVERYHRAVLRVVRAKLGRPMRSLLDSMDIVQSVHRSLLIGLRNDKFQIHSPDQIVALAALMVQRKVARHWRKLKRAPQASSTVMHASNSRGQDASSLVSIDQVADSEPSPSMMLATEELLADCLSKLNEFDQQLVRMKLKGQSTSETARQLGRDPAYIRMRWSRLRQTLRESGCVHQSTSTRPIRG